MNIFYLRCQQCNRQEQRSFHQMTKLCLGHQQWNTCCWISPHPSQLTRWCKETRTWRRTLLCRLCRRTMMTARRARREVLREALCSLCYWYLDLETEQRFLLGSSLCTCWLLLLHLHLVLPFCVHSCNVRRMWIRGSVVNAVSHKWWSGERVFVLCRVSFGQRFGVFVGGIVHVAVSDL